MKKVVIFGGAGFLGSHVADALVEKGYEAVIFDLKAPEQPREGMSFVQGNVLDAEMVKNAVKGAHCVYNFSGLTNIDECSVVPMEVLRSNIIGHANILEQCRQAQVKRVVFASSIYVYGRHGSFYRISKQAGEQVTEEYAQRYGLEYTILRYGSLYGPRAQEWNGVYRYLKQAIKEGKIDYPGTEDAKREYIHVYDAARLSVDILDPKFKDQCVVITGNYTLTSKELMMMISEILNNKVKVKFSSQNPEHHYKITPHSFIPKIGTKLAPNPSVDMAEGMLALINEIYDEVKGEDRK